jgi:hypothetical protein
MNRDLFFIPILAEALQSRDAGDGLRSAFSRIEVLGRLPAHRTGLRQFRMFMSAAARHRATGESDALETPIMQQLILELAAGALDEFPIEREFVAQVVRARAHWQRACDELRREGSVTEIRGGALGLVLRREGHIIKTIRLSPEAPLANVGEIGPGAYCLELDGGRVIWSRQLGKQELLWWAANSADPLELAADSHIPRTGRAPTSEDRAADGFLLVRIFAGVDYGRMEIAYRGPWSDDDDEN